MDVQYMFRSFAELLTISYLNAEKYCQENKSCVCTSTPILHLVLEFPALQAMQ
jgi:hypothetical protein